MAQIKVVGSHWSHSKASEVHVDVTIDDGSRELAFWTIPIVYPRLGLELKTEDEIQQYLSTIVDHLHTTQHEKWRAKQAEYWQGRNQPVTKAVFDTLAESFSWLAYKDLPAVNNAASRLKAIKQMGYTIATRKRPGIDYEFRLLPLPRGDETGYEWWSGQLRARIIRVLGQYDVYEARADAYNHLLPDHKFPESRWDAATQRETLENLTDADIRRDFQLISNQRNQQKREVCRTCLQTGKRGVPFGIAFFYQGGPTWPADVPQRGKAAEAGCIGCGWHDLAAWRQALLATLTAR